jgi:PAS domain S-box-containing protein
LIRYRAELMKQDNAITTERVRILYGKAFASISTALAGVFIFAYIFREQIASPVLVSWVGFMIIVALVRYWLLFDYNKNKQNTPYHDKFEKRFTYATGLVGVGWAFFIVSGLNLPAFEYRVYSLLLLTALVALSVPIFSSSVKTIYFYITPSLIISIPLLLSRGGDDTALGVALIIFTAMVIRSSKDIYNTLNDSLVLRYQTQEQTEDLKQLRHEKSVTEQRMQGVMDNSPAVIYVKDIDGRFSFVNQEFLKLFHLQREDIIGKTLHDVFPKEIADEMRRNDVEVQESGKPLKYEEVAPHDDGPHNYISIKFPLFDEAGVLYAVGGVSTDITERFRIEESLRISQQRLLLHREQSPVGVIEWNTDFEFLDWNPAAEKIFGFTKDEVVGKHITDRILPESARSAVNKVWKDLLANKGGTYSLNENITKDERTILCEWHNTPLVDHDGNVIGVTSLVDDVTERQKSEEELRHSQKMDALGKLTGGIAHDFNNMLGVILGYSELLKECVSNDDPKLIKYTDEIINAGERARKLTSKLLAFSRKAPSSAETTYINELLHGMQHMLEKTLTPRIKLILELDEKLWPVWIDKARLEDAILNMSINSMHAMPDAGTLTLRAYNMHLADSDIHNIDITSGDYVLLSVSDTGIGMSREIQQKMFEPFFTTKGDGGTGLGMSQVYGFIQQSGGNIQVFSESGHGTRITLYIPRHQESEAARPEESTTDSVELPSGQETILVVDDEVALLSLTKEILTKYGYTVLSAESAEQALEILNSKSVDLLLSDVIMPNIDGYQLATEVEKRYPMIKIQMASGFSDEHKMNLVNNKLHQQRLHKPFSSEELLRRIRELLDEEK